jgi:hypothetical protein
MVRSKTLYQSIPKIIGILFIILFVYAATSKLLAIEQFKIQLGKSPFISIYASWMVWTIPVIELLIVGLFIFQKHLLVAFYSSFTLMTLFTIYIFLVLNFSDSIPCACGGIISTLGWRAHFVFNMGFMLLALIGIITTHKQRNFTIPK